MLYALGDNMAVFNRTCRVSSGIAWCGSNAFTARPFFDCSSNVHTGLPNIFSAPKHKTDRLVLSRVMARSGWWKGGDSTAIPHDNDQIFAAIET
jgi:hypothetical protein